MVFQAMFAIITSALIIGSFAERFKFSAFLVFALLWSPLAPTRCATGYGQSGDG